MGRIAERFAALKERGEVALVPFLTAGDPDLETTEALVPALASAGADLIEIGVPFSDPVAEGPTIQRASERALAAGATLRRVLELVRKLRARLDVPVILMGYANSFLTMGEERFAEACREVGVDGAICVDVPPEEGEALYAALADRGVDGILLAAPTTTPERLARLARNSRGFLYYVSLTGVTGARAEMARGIEEQVARAREAAAIPVCVGFGVSTPEHASELARFADGVVVGSALVDRIAATSTPDEAVDAAARFVSELKAPLRCRAGDS
ncbi:MAG: tryptophan synthase subunit alpha [Myxococcota bacterium]|nr:tryptophan synthase subunit alpha [Myxococcota bacterium]